jgi:hypothetical protein
MFAMEREIQVIFFSVPMTPTLRTKSNVKLNK